jgi:hypothetical protein
MKTLKQRIVDMLFRLEWAANSNDGHGERCPFCGVERGVEHNCELHRLCEEIRDVLKPRDTSLDDVEVET